VRRKWRHRTALVFSFAPSAELILLDADRYSAVVDPHDTPLGYELQEACATQQGRPADRELHTLSGSRRLISSEQDTSAAEVDG
jgi:hypothetical protein